MKTYYIKLNGHIIGKAKGKNNSVKYLEKIIKINKYDKNTYVWESFLSGKLKLHIDPYNQYSIEG